MRARASEGGGKNGEMRRCTCGMLDDTKGLRWSWAARPSHGPLVPPDQSIHLRHAHMATDTSNRDKDTDTSDRDTDTDTDTHQCGPTVFCREYQWQQQHGHARSDARRRRGPGPIACGTSPTNSWPRHNDSTLSALQVHVHVCVCVHLCTLACEKMRVWPGGSNVVGFARHRP